MLLFDGVYGPVVMLLMVTISSNIQSMVLEQCSLMESGLRNVMFIVCLSLRKLVSAVKQGGSYFQLLQEQEEQKNEKRRKKEERRRTDHHHPFSDSGIENEEER